MSESTYPPYVSDHGHGEVCMAFPGVVQDGLMFMFAFPADSSRVQQLVDTFLNQPAKGAVEYAVLGGHVFLSFLKGRLTSGGEVVGYVDDNECGFWVPLVARSASDGATRLVFWMPYIIIDNFEGLVTGREGWGYRKGLGPVLIPESPKGADAFEASTRIFKVFSKETAGVVEPLIRLRREPGMEARGPETTFPDGKALVEAFTRAWLGDSEASTEGKLPISKWKLLFNVLEILRHRHVPVVNLKQFRDAKDGNKACYQALIEGPLTVTRFGGGGLMRGDFTLDITPCQSHPIAADLGLQLPTRSRFGMWVRMDFDVEPGQEVWKAP
jgi:hypothetical protein